MTRIHETDACAILLALLGSPVSPAHKETTMLVPTPRRHELRRTATGPSGNLVDLLVLAAVALALSVAPAYAGGGGCTGNGCEGSIHCTSIALTEQNIGLDVETHLDSYSDMADPVEVSPTIRDSKWLRVVAEGTMGKLGDVRVTLNPATGNSVYRMISQSPTGVPFFPADVEARFYWRFETNHPITGQPLVLESEETVYEAQGVSSFPPSPGTVFELTSGMVLIDAGTSGLSCFADPGEGRVVYSGIGIDPPILINEIDPDAGGGGQFVELFDGGRGATPLNGVKLVRFDSANDLSYGEAIDLTGFTTGPDGFFVVGAASVPGVDLVVDLDLQEIAGAVGLYVSDVSFFPPGSPPSAVELMEAVVWAPTGSPDLGLRSLLRAGMPQPDEAAAGDPAGNSLQRIPNGGWRRDTRPFRPLPPTPGRLNGGAIVIPTQSRSGLLLLGLVLALAALALLGSRSWRRLSRRI